MTNAQREQCNEIVIRYFQPSIYADLLIERQHREELKVAYQDTITQLQKIEDTASPTNAQVVAAVKFLAKTIRLMLRLFIRHYL